jgi:hypothetical protein
MMTSRSAETLLRNCCMEMQAWRDSYATAVNAAEAFKGALGEIGVRERFYHSFRPTVAPPGLPFVHVGYLPADVAERIAEALRHHSPGSPALGHPEPTDRQDG